MSETANCKTYKVYQPSVRQTLYALQVTIRFYKWHFI